MTPEQIVATDAASLAATLGIELEAARKARKRAQQALWQRKYRRQGRGARGHLDGPPIGRDATEERMRKNAIRGSQRLLAEIRRVFA